MVIKRREFLYLSGISALGFSLSGVVGGSAMAANGKKQPNILWIVAEDMGPELGCYGTEELRTPNLDALAEKGMRFTNTFTTSPVCSPSRSAFNTGMYQTTIGAHNHRSHRSDDPSSYPFPLQDGVNIISDWMRQAGYFTANIRDYPGGIDFNSTQKTDWNFSYDGNPFDSNQWSDLKDNQPFYAQAQFPETHRGGHWDNAHKEIQWTADPAKVNIPPYYPDHPMVREVWAQYHNTIMALDEKVGVVLDLLEKDGLAENTIVIFMADHGRAMVRGKQWPYDSGLHVPLLIYIPESVEAPDQYNAGTVSDQLISSIDITATTLALTGSPIPEKMQGQPFMGNKAKAPRRYLFGGRDRGDETIDRIRTVRTKRYRYIRNFMPGKPFLQINRYKETNYPTIWVLRKLQQEGKLTPAQEKLLAPERPQEELYDILNDPYEINNLHDSPEHKALLHHFRQVLDDWIRESRDQGRFPEDPAVYEYYEEQMKEIYDHRIREIQKEWGIQKW